MKLVNKSFSWLLFFAVCALSSPAQEAEPLKDEETAKVRFWNMCPAGGPTFNLFVREGENEKPLISGMRWFEYTEYERLEPKNYTFVVQNADTGKSIAELKIDAGRQQYFTILARPEGNRIAASIIDDTYNYARGAPGDATVYQFVPGLTAEIVSPDGKKKVIRYGETASFQNLPVSCELQFHGSKPDGTPYEGMIPLAFEIGNRISVLILQDRYQRIRTRSFYRGYIFAQDEVPPSPSPMP